jgi:hypothetical protein
MTRTTRLASAGAAACLLSVLAAPAALAQTTADYPGRGDTAVGGVVVTAPGTAPTRTGAAPSTLPFTGGEVVLIAAAGAAAVAAGAAMVAGGRRRAGADS